jgi:hypothetical protein
MTTPDGPVDYLELADRELLGQCEVHTFRGSGPGGQKRNKTESAVRLQHGPTGITVQCDETRSQHQNRARALRQLRERIALTCRRPVDLERHQVSAGLARLAGRTLGPRSADYLPAVAALLDLFVACGCSVRDTAERLGLSTGALSRLLLADDRLARAANALRAERQLRPLR